ncbi:MAG: hypothetical protein IT366_08905 [Candidatus Hydrogenedentes bacterium]|nr:hypothetical protein [Candidatus Hydrogenedentota bacterium]
MEAICGILGRRDADALDAMVAALRGRADATHKSIAENYAVAASHPLDELSLIDGKPRVKTVANLSPALFHRYCMKSTRTFALEIKGAYACAVGLDGGSRWWLMRDRLGQRPLYYFHGNGFLAFASELKALLASGLVPKRLNLLAVDRYLTLRCVPGAESIIAGVHRVQPGYVLEYRDGHINETRIATFELQTREQPRETSVRELRDHLTAALERNSADNVLWSGGIDCASLAALRSELKPVFVTLDRVWQDESRLATESARLMERTLQTLHARRLTEDTVHKAVRALDEPLADPSVLPLWLIAEAAAEQQTAYVSGHGADELLGGYPRFNFLQKARGAKDLVPAGLLTDLMPALPPNAFIRRGSQYLVSMHDAQESYLSLVSVFDRGERESLYTDAMKSAIYDLGGGIPAVKEHFGEPDLTRNVLSLDLHVGLPNLLLSKCDRIFAAHGLQVDFPYLDDDLVDFAIGLSAKAKYGVRSKPLLRLATRGKLPTPVRMRARRDFRIPQSGRALRVIDNVARECVTPDRVDALGLFRWHAVDEILREATHNVYRRRQYWALVMFFAWYRNVMES